ncbi:MAG: type IV secretory system conjugative DNA transfer family protein [Acidimicrobiales bacterium]
MPHVTMSAVGIGTALAALAALEITRSTGQRVPGWPGQSARAGRESSADWWRGWSRWDRPDRQIGPGGSRGRRPTARSPQLGGRRGAGARWATRRDVRPLVVPRPRPERADREPTFGTRLVMGRLARPGGRSGRVLLAAEPGQSVAVVGPTQSGKTTALAIPAILGWAGPVVAASVKTDLVRDTLDWRRSRGTVWCFDPARTTGLPASGWSPLPAARTWGGARRMAADLTEVAHGPGTTADGEFWYAAAAKLLAPLLYGASAAGLTMHDVVRWVDTQEVAEVAEILETTDSPEALQAARATWLRDERQRSSVYTTAETVLEPFAEPYGMPTTGCGDIDAGALLDGPNTLYLCAPAHDQRRLRGLFTTVVKQVVETAYTRSSARGAPLTPPLLVVLDEAANIAPLPELDGLAATCAGHGVQLVTVWQDLAQMAARYGERSSTVVNNHRATLFLSGTSDPRTLDHASHLVGDEEIQIPSVTRDAMGGRTVTTTVTRRPLLPPDALRQMPAGTGVLVYGALPPVYLTLHPWYTDPVLSLRCGRAATDALSTAPSGPPRAGRSPRSARRHGSGRR